MILQWSESPTDAAMRSVFGHERPLIVKRKRPTGDARASSLDRGTLLISRAVSANATATESGVSMITKTRSPVLALGPAVSMMIAPARMPAIRVCLSDAEGDAARYM